jgi:hypothetical protein
VPIARRLGGLRGMAWGAASVINIHMTASRLSRLPDLALGGSDDTEPRRARSSANSKILYQYLRGERHPTSGPRGKYGYDLTAAVHALPGGALARLWLESVLWEVLDPDLSEERARSILSLTEQHQQVMPAREYIRAWCRYRLAMIEQATKAEVKARRTDIARLHKTLSHYDPVFCYIAGPLTFYLHKCEPHIPIQYKSNEVGKKSWLGSALNQADARRKQINDRFDNGVRRYLISERLPDRRFLKRFDNRWCALWLRWQSYEAAYEETNSDSRRTADKEKPTDCIAWQPVCEAMGIRQPTGNFQAVLGSTRHASVNRNRRPRERNRRFVSARRVA